MNSKKYFRPVPLAVVLFLGLIAVGVGRLHPVVQTPVQVNAGDPPLVTMSLAADAPPLGKVAPEQREHIIRSVLANSWQYVPEAAYTQVSSDYFPASNGLIAFSGGDGHLYTMNPDGSGQVALVTNLQNLADPAWSPGEEYLAFVGDGANDRCLYKLNYRNRQWESLICGFYALWEPRWSADASYLAFGGQQTEGGSSRIWAVPASGGILIELTPGLVSVLSPDWLDGDTLLLAGEEAGDIWHIYQVDVNHPDQPQAMTPDIACVPCACTEGSVLAAYPVLSPDGSTISFLGGRSEGDKTTCTAYYAVYTVSATGGTPLKIADVADTSGTGTAAVWTMRWAPNGGKVGLLAGGSDAILRLTTVDLASSTLKTLHGREGGGWNRWDWAPDGTLMAAGYVPSSGSGELDVVDPVGDIFTTRAPGGAPAWSTLPRDYPIVTDARLDITMPYSSTRGCSSPYQGCGGPFHGFYRGVCTDLVLDAYNGGASFNIQQALAADHRANPGRYRYGTARNAEDMRRYFLHNQSLLPNAESYQPGDIGVFDWDGGGLSDHVLIVSEVDGAGRPTRMVDASGTWPGNPTGNAYEHDWSSYYDQTSQGHGRLANQPLTQPESISQPLQVLRVTLDSAAASLRVVDAQGKFRSEQYDENLVASNVEAAIPYIPSSTFENTGSNQLVTVFDPLSNGSNYVVELKAGSNTSFSLLIETLQDSLVTDSEQYTGNIGSGQTDVVKLSLVSSGGTISFTGQAPLLSPSLGTPDLLEIAGSSGSIVQVQFVVSEVGNHVPLNNVHVSVTDLHDQMGTVVPASAISVSPGVFSLAPGGNRNVTVTVDQTSVRPGVYEGAMPVLPVDTSGRRVQLKLSVLFHKTYLPTIAKF